MFISEAKKHSGNALPYRAKDMAYSNAPPISLHKEQEQPKSYPEKMVLERSNALQKALKPNFQLLKGGTSLGEELE